MSSKAALIVLSVVLMATVAHATGRSMLQMVPCDGSVSKGCTACSAAKSAGSGLVCTSCGENAYVAANGQCGEWAVAGAGLWGGAILVARGRARGGP
jgi:hypothetical protein